MACIIVATNRPICSLSPLDVETFLIKRMERATIHPNDFYILGNSSRPPADPTERGHDRPPILPGDFGDRAVLIWDTETAGLSNPGICQLSYILIENGTITEYDKILKLPKQVCMSSTATSIHRITAEASASGADAEPELIDFWDLTWRIISSGGHVVGHNVSFDCRAFSFTCAKLGLTHSMTHTDMIDTMALSKPHTHLRNVRGYPKQYRLSELYERLFGAPPDWARLHDSLEDVRVTALCYREGQRIGWW